jgi:C4-dicarboxylate-specific signal transduction histidine kinase
VSYCEASLQELRSERPNPEKQNRNLGRAVAEAHRAAKLIRELRGFILKRQADSERFEMRSVVAAALNLVGPHARARGVRIQTKAEEGLPAVKGRVVQIEQLLVNLLNNAIDSISSAGSKSGMITIRTQSDPSGVVQVSIEDSGPGLDTQVARRMFEPFFTTKAGGLGIGLMIARSIAEAHGGRLWAEQAASGGTVFHFSVPFWI